MLLVFIAVTGSTSVGIVGLHIYGEPAGSVANPTASSRSEDYYETSGDSGSGDLIDDRREYRSILSLL